VASGIQTTVLQKTKGADTEDRKRLLMQPTVAVLPNNATFEETFRQSGDQYVYTGDPFLGAETLAQHSAKFASVIRSIEAGEGIAFVYSNYVSMGAVLFAMALEEHGYTSAMGSPLLQNPAYTGASKGKYALLTSTISEKAIAKLVNQARSERNRDGSQIRVIITSPLVAEGVDFRCVRQAHILDPWWNMSRIEQVVGRSLRTCSHTLLTEAKQNCTVYLHVVRTADGGECYDEYTYRTKVEPKAIKIARVRSVLEQWAMDCTFRIDLPEDWERLVVHQERSEGHEGVAYRLEEMLAPSFLRDATKDCAPRQDTKDTTHVRPLSSVLDVRDEVLDKTAQLLVEKPIWDRKDLIQALAPYTEQVIIYTLQKAIETGYPFRDAFNRKAVLESRGDLYALLPLEVDSRTFADRTLKPVPRGRKALPALTRAPAPVVEVPPTLLEEKEAKLELPGDAKTRFSREVLHGYIFDHLLTESEKIALLRRSDVSTLPFADRLRVPGTSILIRGLNRFDPDEEPIGDDRTRVDEWTAALADRFSEVIAANTIFTSLAESGKFTLSKVRVSGTEVVRAYEPTSKTFLPTICGTGVHKEDVPFALAKTLDSRGVGIPATVIKVPNVCTYAELLAREQHNSVWFTPEELSILYGDPALRTRFTAEFKKTNPR
jgi:hypothetical protein